MEKLALLKKYYGHSEFRQGQDVAIDSIMNGKDVICVMPTGGGKSICYQIPALMQKGLTVVISPLISLMNDQVMALNQLGIASASINSSLSFESYEINDILDSCRSGAIKLLYVAPERLLTPSFINFSKSANISLIAIDEAHCVSQWGQDFRPSYLKIKDYIDSFAVRPIVSAFTATATKIVKNDMTKLLGLQNPVQVFNGFDRPNLYFSVESAYNKNARLLEIVKSKQNLSGIVYCLSRKNVDNTCRFLNECGFNATRYHAGLTKEERTQNQMDFVYDRKNIMVATTAFGMGIDKPNVSYVVHFNMPRNIEGYYQEAGRAGRDGRQAECIMLYNYNDYRIHQYMIDNTEYDESLSTQQIKQLQVRDYKRLDIIYNYCQTATCLRSYILNYFGEDIDKFYKCDNCSNCDNGYERKDATINAQKIICCIIRAKKNYPQEIIQDVLYGKISDIIEKEQLNNLTTFAIMKDVSKGESDLIIETMIEENILKKNENYDLIITNKANLVLKNQLQVIIRVKKSAVSTKSKNMSTTSRNNKAPQNNTTPLTPQDMEYIKKLKIVREKIADRESVPPYVVFSDGTLILIAQKKPTNLKMLTEIAGMPELKAKKYCKAIVEVFN